MKTKLIVALDTNNINEVEKLVMQLKDAVYGFKVGYQLFLSQGLSLFEFLAKYDTNIFLDLKFHDIPSVVKKGVKEILKFNNVKMFTMHLLGGEEMVKETMDYIKGIKKDVLPLGVTVLTSMGKRELASLGIENNVEEQVVTLARLAKRAGVKGLVCSAKELTLLRKEFQEYFKLVTPGIRLSKKDKGDQKRITLPEEAAEKGADYIVMGRTIINSTQPRRTTEEVISRL